MFVASSLLLKQVEGDYTVDVVADSDEILSDS